MMQGTTYQSTYRARDQRYPTDAIRPGTSKFYTSPPKMENSTYDTEYYEKVWSKPKPIFSATSSGQRRNNPHPSREFMVWKIPRGGAQQDEVVLEEAKLKEILKKQLTTSYQYDYIGTQPEEAPEIAQRMKALRSANKKQYFTGTSMRHTYTVPKVDSLLQGNTSRYGCNSKKNQSAIGIVPTVQKHQNSLNPPKSTSYTQEFGN